MINARNNIENNLQHHRNGHESVSLPETVGHDCTSTSAANSPYCVLLSMESRFLKILKYHS